MLATFMIIINMQDSCAHIFQLFSSLFSSFIFELFSSFWDLNLVAFAGAFWDSLLSNIHVHSLQSQQHSDLNRRCPGQQLHCLQGWLLQQPTGGSTDLPVGTDTILLHVLYMAGHLLITLQICCETTYIGCVFLSISPTSCAWSPTMQYIIACQTT